MGAIPRLWSLLVASSKYFVVTVPYSQPSARSLQDLVEHVAFVDLACDGMESMNLEAEQVNEILREKAVGGGEIPIEVVQEVEDAGERDPHASTKFFFHGKGAKERAGRFFNFVTENISPKTELDSRSWQDWNKVWRKSFAPIEVTERIAVYPEWYKEGRVSHPNPLFIYPGMGFGTGGHETTHMFLQLFYQVALSGSKDHAPSCLDFGCGSGILGIAAMKYADAHSDFCDIDRSALDNCVQNLAMNFSVDELSVIGRRHGREIQLVARDRFRPGRAYDIVFANILENILIDEKDVLVQSVAQSGYLILSGLLKPQAEGIMQLYSGPSTGLVAVDTVYRGDWAALLLVCR